MHDLSQFGGLIAIAFDGKEKSYRSTSSGLNGTLDKGHSLTLIVWAARQIVTMTDILKLQCNLQKKKEHGSIPRSLLYQQPA
jgi:hypothetical protein